MSRRRSHAEQLSLALERVGPSALALAAPAPPAGEKARDVVTPRLGTHGQNYSSGFMQEEWNEELQDWETRVGKLDELRRGDSVVSSTLRRPRTSILRATWTIEPGEAVTMPGTQPAAEEDQRSQLAAMVLTANLLGVGPAEYRMRTTWTQFLREAYTAEAIGVAFFERTLRLQPGPLGTFQIIDGLWWMHPRSITKLFIDRNGTLLGVLQEWKASYYEQAGEQAIAKDETVKRAILAEDLIVRTCDQEGSDVTGNPRTRPMWMDAKRRNFLAQAQVVDAQKRAVGIPYVKLGANAQGEAKEFAITQAKRLREGGNELSYVVMMEGDEVGFLDMSANVPDLDAMLRAQEGRIRTVGSQEQFALGQEGSGGSRAVASTNSQYYDIDVEATAEDLRSDIQRQALEPVALLNFPGVPTPQLRVANIAPPNIAPVVQLAAAGGIKFRSKDEQHYRKIYRLPLLSEQEMAERDAAAQAAREQLQQLPGAQDPPKPGDKQEPPPKGGAKDEPPPPPKEEPPKKLAGVRERGAVVEGIARRLWRDPTRHEREFLRLADIERSFDDFMRDWVQQVRSLREAAILEGLRKTRVSAKRAIVGRLRSAPFQDVIGELARQMRERGRESARLEVERQVQAFARGLQLEDDREGDAPPVVSAPRDPAKARARESAAEVAAELQQEADVRVTYDVGKIIEDVVRGIERSMLQALEEGQSEEQAKDAARRSLLGKSDFDLASLARGQASKNFNDGRAEVAAQVRETLEKSPETGLRLGTVVRSEILDDATCETCESVDGKVIEIDSDDYWEWMPPNKCQGGSRCRGFYVLVVEREERAA